jgi:hypothetical protein
MALTDQQKQYQREWYAKNAEKRKDESSERRKRRAASFLEYKKTLCCEVCGEDATECLDFHHRVGEKKEANVSDAAMYWSVERIMTEVEKCHVLCSNCHRKVHSGRIILQSVG